MDLTTTYNAIFAHTRSRLGGDPSGSASRTTRLPLGVGLQGMGLQAIEMDAPDGGGKLETDYGLAAYEAAFGKAATVQDYTQLVEQRRPLPGSNCIPSLTEKKEGKHDSKKKGSFDASSKDRYPGETRPFVPKWQCGCGFHNFYYAKSNFQGQNDTTVNDKCRGCGQPKKEAGKSSNYKHPVKEPSLGAAAIEKLIEERVASGVKKSIDAQKTSDGSAIAGFAQADFSGNAFSLGLGGIIEDNKPRLPEDGEAVIDKFGNNADAYLRRGTNFSEAMVHQLENMSCIFMVLSCICGIASSVTNRLGQACNTVITWMAPAAGDRPATTAGVCILLACCVLFTQLASTQALNLHTINAIGAQHAIETWSIESSSTNATTRVRNVLAIMLSKIGLKRIAQSHQQYCLQAANGFAKGQLFLDSGTDLDSKAIVNNPIGRDSRRRLTRRLCFNSTPHEAALLQLNGSRGGSASTQRRVCLSL